MWVFPSGMKVYLALGYTDMRKSVNGLSITVSECMEQDPFSGHLFVFCSVPRTRAKALGTVFEMREGPSESLFRRRFQTTQCCYGQKAMVVSDWDKSSLRWQVSAEEMSEGEPLMTYRKRREAVKTRGCRNSGINSRETWLPRGWQPVYRRDDLGIGSDTERGNLSGDVKGNSQVRGPHEGKHRSTE